MCSIIIFFYCCIIIYFVRSHNIYFPNHEPPAFEVVTKFLQNFAEFHIIFHANSTTIYFANELLYKLSLNKSLNTYHIYQDDLTVSENFKRPNLSNILNVVLTEESTAWGRFNDSSKLNQRDVVLFVYQTEIFITKLLNNGLTILKISGNTLVLQIINSTAFVYRICYYCGGDSLKKNLIYSSNSTENYEDENLKELILPNNFKDFNGHVLHLIYVQYFPFAYCKTPREEIFTKNRRILTCSISAGIESNQVRILSQKLNFSYLIHTLDSNASFFDMIMYVHNNLADFAFGGISVTEERMPLIQFSDEFNMEDYVFLYRLQPNFRQVFNKFLEPFNEKTVWILFSISYVFCCCMLYIYSLVSGKGNISGIFYIFWLLLHTPIEQSTSWAKGLSSYTGLTSTITFGLWWWACLIITTLYKSSILSTMIHPLNSDPDSLHDLIFNDFSIVGNIYYKDIITEMLDINDANFKRALSTISFQGGPCETLDKILQGGVAMLDELSELQFELRTLCPQLSGYPIDNFRITRKSVRSLGHAWALQIGAPYRAALDHYTSLILSAGLFQKWSEDETFKVRSHTFHHSREIKEQNFTPLTLVRLTPIMMIYAAGILCSVSCFGIEILCYYFEGIQQSIIKKVRR